VVSWGTVPGLYTSSANAGNNTTYTVTGLATDRRYYFVVQACTAENLCSRPSSEVSNNALITQANGTLPDAKPDLFWYNKVTGQVMTWHMVGTTVLDSRKLSIDGVPDLTWKIAGVGDINGDRHSDIIWRNTDGSLAVWFLTNTQVTGTQMLPYKVADPAWRLAGVGDVNGDTYADLMWQNSDGSTGVWYMRLGQVVGTVVLPYNVGVNSVWQIAAMGDVNKDGYSDIIWQTTDGFLAVWLLRGGQVLLTAYFSIPQMPDANWRIRAVATPEGTGHPALVWRHEITGAVAFWYVNSTTVLSTTMTTPSIVDNLNWTVVGTR
jgi:hypothetical protein